MAIAGVPTAYGPCGLPEEVLEPIYAYEKEHSVDRNMLISAAMKSLKARPKDKVVE